MSEDTLNRIFARNLNTCLKCVGKSQKEVADKLGISVSTFSSWCTGAKMPRMDKIELLANYFGVQKSDLIEDKTVKEQTELEEYLEYLRTRPEMKMLFSLTKGASKEDVEKAVKIIETLLGKNE